MAHPLSSLTCSLADVALETIGSLHVFMHEHSKDETDAVAPVLLTIYGQIAAGACGGKVLTKDVKEILEAATLTIRDWMKTPDGDRLERPGNPESPIGDVQVTVGTVARECILGFSNAAGEAARKGNLLAGFRVGMAGRAATENFIGSLVAYLTDEPAPMCEIEGLLSEIADELKAEMLAEDPPEVAAMMREIDAQMGLGGVEAPPAELEGTVFSATEYRDHLEGYA